MSAKKIDDSQRYELYTQVARLSAGKVIDAYSTSFGWATRILKPVVRNRIKDIYALVRVADEIVDGAAAGAITRGGVIDARKQLDGLEAETYRAMKSGFSTNLVVHAFAVTAVEVGIQRSIIEPFFASMRMDLTEQKHTKKSFDTYVFGSAEVIGLMCFRAFVAGREEKLSVVDAAILEKGTRALGAAFQKINFLRDLSEDFESLGRSYFPNVTVKSFSNAQRDELIADIRIDLKAASDSLRLLPRDVRPAVAAAEMLFAALTDKVAATPASILMHTRIRVNNFAKLVILLKALIGVVPK